MGTLSFRKTSDSFDGVITALRDIHGGISSDILGAKKIVVKINFVSTLKRLATTPVESVRAFIEFTKELGYSGEIVVAETATMGLTKLGFKQFGFYKLEREYTNVKIFDLRNDESVPISLVDSDGNEVIADYSKLLKEADYVVSACRAKTHNAVGTTLSIKNLAVGGIISRRSIVHQGSNIHKNIEILTTFRKPDLAIIDGVVGMEGDGPISGTPINSEWVIVGTDCVAADSLGTKLMGFNLEDAGYIRLCAEAGVGFLYGDAGLQELGDSISTVPSYKPHSNFDSQPKV